MIDQTPPTWLEEPCPAWCARRHEEDDHPEDRYHQSEGALLAGIAGAADTVPLTASLRATSLAVHLGRHPGEESAWVAVEALDDLHPRLILTAQTARTLARELVAQATLPD